MQVIDQMREGGVESSIGVTPRGSECPSFAAFQLRIIRQLVPWAVCWLADASISQATLASPSLIIWRISMGEGRSRAGSGEEMSGPLTSAGEAEADLKPLLPSFGAFGRRSTASCDRLEAYWYG